MEGKSSTLDLGECGISTSVGRVGSHGRYLQVKGEVVHGGGWEEEVVFLRKRHNSLGGGQNWSQTGVFGLEVKTLLMAL